MNKKVLVIGSGPIVIGQACEFDYSGIQACKVFKNKGFNVVLLNNNPATIMTDCSKKCKVYMESIDEYVLDKIIKLENPDFIYPSVGGQTSLNLLLNYFKEDKKISILGPSLKSIKKSESRKEFRKTMKKNKLPISYSYYSNNIIDSLKIRKKIMRYSKKKSVSIRPSFTLGGLGGGVSNNMKEFVRICKKGLMLSRNKEILIEESLYGEKEIELELLIDKNSNFLVVCSIENIDPVGVHTGDSVCVCPIQTLTDNEYQNIRDLSYKAIKSIGLKSCGANVQFSINKKTGYVKIIEINPRLSRSSALASKATGYPIAKIATKLSIGYSFNEIKNNIIRRLPAFLEPSLDYIVTKIPKFSVRKFGMEKEILGNQMKSVGESMSICNSLESSLIKCSIGVLEDFSFKNEVNEKRNLKKKIFFPNNDRIFNIFESINMGVKIRKISNFSKIDIFFLKKILNLSTSGNLLRKKKFKKNNFLNFKKIGFSDLYISKLLRIDYRSIINYRLSNKIIPNYKKVDNCSGEFYSYTNYFYNSYSGNCEIKLDNKEKILIIGSGANRIGQGIEFDYCCVHASEFLKNTKYKSVIINNNPETVSTDYDVSDYLFFSPIDFEDIINIYIKLKIKGIIVQFCGQLSNFIINLLKKYKIKILGTSLKNIKYAESRRCFNFLLEKKNIPQPKSVIIKKKKYFFKKIKNINIPLIIRPSYILGGESMEIIKSYKLLKEYYKNRFNSKKFPILIEEFLYNCYEFDVDCICDGNNSIFFPVIQHVEKTGVHSGDSTSYIPCCLRKKQLFKLFNICKVILRKFKIIGFANIQVALNVKSKKFYIIELNPRASRTIPFLLKVLGRKIINEAMMVIIFNKKIKNKIFLSNKKYFFIKEPVFSFIKFNNSDPLLGPEMKSTGEILSYGSNIFESYLKTQFFLGLKNIYYIYIFSNYKNVYFYKYVKILKKKIIFFNISEKYNLYNIKKKCVSYVDNNYKYGKKTRIFLKNNNIVFYTNLETFNFFLKCLIVKKNIVIKNLEKIYN
ncbi:carbamoyl-phosphate synthase large subunit [Candidatus Vidania fulgoroideorum]